MTKVQMQKYIELTEQQGYKAIVEVGEGIGGPILMESPEGKRVLLQPSGKVDPLELP